MQLNAVTATRTKNTAEGCHTPHDPARSYVNGRGARVIELGYETRP